MPISKPILIGLYLAIGGFLYGFDSGVLTPTLVTTYFNRYFDQPDANMRGALVSVYQGGGFVGAVMTGPIADRFGRRKTILLGALLGILGSILMTAAAHIAMLLLGRIILGIAVSIMTSAGPVYCSEIARKNERGRLSAATQLAVALGFFVANWTGYGFKRVLGDVQWRIPFMLQAIPSIALACGVMFLPESPRWLCLKGREVEAAAVVHRLHGNMDSPEQCQQTINQIRESVRADLNKDPELPWSTILKTPSLRKRLFFGVWVWVAKIISGLSFVQYFSPFIYKALNFSPDQVLLVTGLYGSLSPFCVTASFFYVDRLPRVWLLIFSSAGWFFAYTTLTALSAIYPPVAGVTVNVNAQRASVACVFLVSFFHSTGAGPIAWTYPSEVFTTQMRSRGNSAAQGANYGLSVLLAQVSPLALEKIGWKYYILFCITNFCCAVGFVFFPETKGKTLEELADLFGDKPDAAIESSYYEEKDKLEDDVRVENLVETVEQQKPGIKIEGKL